MIHNAAYGAPLLRRLREHSAARPHQFHIPGHKCGRGMDREFREFVGENALAIDLVNIAPLDDLHSPHGVIRQAEELAAAAFGAERCFFSVQGTSTAIMAMIMSVCGPGDKILMPRNAHRSAMAAVILSGAVPVFLRPEIDRKSGIAHGVSPQTVQAALQLHSEARAILLVNPTYFGACADVAAIAQMVHAYDIPLLVDEAHGAHLYFHPQLPPSAMTSGADAAAVSMHKLCGSLTQSSLLNIQGQLVSARRVRAMLSLLTTTSTSYLLLSSLDAARRHMVTHGEELLGNALRLANYARREINRIPGLYCPGLTLEDGCRARFAYDPTKLFISVSDLGISGLEVEKRLRHEFQTEVELSDPHNILCVITIADTASEIEHLLKALRTIASTCSPVSGYSMHLPQAREHALAISPRQALYAQTMPVPISKAVGETAAEFVTVYPPGIPLLVPGEAITADDVDDIRYYQGLGFSVQGPEDEHLASLKVVVRGSVNHGHERARILSSGPIPDPKALGSGLRYGC